MSLSRIALSLVDRDFLFRKIKKNADSRDRTSDLQIFSLTLSQLSYTGMLPLDRSALCLMTIKSPLLFAVATHLAAHSVPVA